MKRHRSRRGRPRSERPAVDLGTPELRARRRARMPTQRPNWPEPDTNATENALGILLWQGILHSDYTAAKRMHDAGITFCGWWVLVHPATFLKGSLAHIVLGTLSDIDTAAAEARLKSAAMYLAKDRAVLDAVINTCVYQRINMRQIEKLRAGLCRLVEWQRAREKRA